MVVVRTVCLLILAVPNLDETPRSERSRSQPDIVHAVFMLDRWPWPGKRVKLGCNRCNLDFRLHSSELCIGLPLLFAGRWCMLRPFDARGYTLFGESRPFPPANIRLLIFHPIHQSCKFTRCSPSKRPYPGVANSRWRSTTPIFPT